MNKWRLLILLAWLTLGATPASPAAENEVWIRPKDANGALIWGRRDGLIFGLPSPGGIRGPRGLIRVGLVGKNGEAELTSRWRQAPAHASAAWRSANLK